MPYFTYDTSVIISRKLIVPPAKTANFVMSAVVLMELSASAQDNSRLKVYERLFRDYQRDKSLILPNEDDWLLASKACIGLRRADVELAKEGCRDLLQESHSVWPSML
jgi:endonuclease III